MATRDVPQAPVRRQVPALAAGLAVLAVGGTLSVLAMPLLRPDPACASPRDRALTEVLAERPELDLLPPDATETSEARVTSCAGGVPTASATYVGTQPLDAVDHLDGVLVERGWTRAAKIARPEDGVAPLACWQSMVDGAAAVLTVEEVDPVDDAVTRGPGYAVEIRAAHDAVATC